MASPPTELDAVYRERAHLVAALAARWPAVRTPMDADGYSVVYIDSPAGQLSWHIHQADIGLFRHVALTGTPPEQLWDGHSTEEKYQRVASLCYDDLMANKQEERTPAVGRIVHYVSYGTPGGEFSKSCRAAVITEVTGERDLYPGTWIVGLCVLNPSGQFFNQSVMQSDDHHDGGTWHWPEQVG